MKPVYPHQLMRHFDTIRVKSTRQGRIDDLLNLVGTDPADEHPQHAVHRRPLDRRCGIDRRNRQLPVLMDTRSPHARRKQRQRRRQDTSNNEQDRIGIDVYS